jgi:hypothetical protein
MTAHGGEADGLGAIDGAAADAAAHRRELIREGVTMALYISLSLLAVMVALPPDISPAASSTPALALFVTAFGLLIAHALAFRISARLAHRGRLASEHLELLGVQIVGGLAVTIVAAAPVLLFGAATGVLVAELLLVAFIAVVAYAAVRMVPVSRGRAVTYVAAVVLLALVAVGIKNLVH